MNPSILQNLCNIFIVIGVIITGLAGFGNFYFGKKIAELKDRKTAEEKVELNSKIESLLKGNEELKTSLEPFKDIAKEKFPNENVQNALNRLSEELHSLNKKTEKTAFKIESSEKSKTPSGEYETKIILKPIGENIIPIFTVVAKTQNSAIIKEFKIDGPTIPMISYNTTADDRTAQKREFQAIRPGEVTVTIITDKDPGRMQIAIDPISE